MPLEVFYSYAHEDETLRDKLEEHLTTLKRQGAIVGWHDRDIGAGREWRDQIDEHMRSAHIILLLISSSFLASEYCHDVEMALALERHAKGEAIVIPVILRPADWSGAAFAKLQALPRNAKPITTWSNEDEAFLDVALGIRRVVEGFGARPPAGTRSAVAPKGALPNSRVLDAAIPSRVVRDHATELQVLIRLPDSPGLRGLLASDEEADADEEDVNSKEFKVTFPRGPDGAPEGLKAKVLLTSPDFDPPRQKKALFVPPDGDSELAAFLLTPRRVGRLKILVELLWDDATRAPRRLLTQCVAEATSVPADVSRSVVQIPLEISPGPQRPSAEVRRDATRPASQAAEPFRPSGDSASGTGAVPAVHGLPPVHHAGNSAKVGLAGASSLGLAAAVWFALGTTNEITPQTAVASLESCYEQVFRQANIEKTSGLVDATLALRDGSIATKTSRERVALYRELDSAAVRTSIEGCNQQYNQTALAVPIVVNVRAAHQRLVNAKVGLRNQLSSVLTNAEGKASLSIPLGSMQKETIPLSVDWRGASFDLTPTLLDLENGKPLDLGALGALEIRVTRRPRCSPATSATLRFDPASTMRVWSEGAEQPHSATSLLHAELKDGVVRLDYMGPLSLLDVTLDGSGGRVSYPRPEPSNGVLELVYPDRDCEPSCTPALRANLRHVVQDRLAALEGGRVATITVRPTTNGFQCSLAVCDEIQRPFDPRWATCPPFEAHVRTD